MQVYLDDIRPTPEGWHRTYSATETIEVLKSGGVVELSLDHDLGILDEHGVDIETGYTVLLWLEEAVACNGFVSPEKIMVHSDNSSAREKMERAIKQIHRLHERSK